ncbi:RagB/SusD family nutrient uptake outer membrane protein [Compostibacter hankyongensis]|uniref:RagB/SusD family nutrient uptake outer membrane protein n=1 Tax=Compostibacter hankyongensis TaxID=1007089 RepID=A0ABP8FS05_9BACT
MKRILVLLLAGSGIVASSCNTNLLDTSPDNKYVESNFWKSEAAANAALSGCYSVLSYSGLFGGDATPLLEDAASPNAYSYGNTSGFNSIANGQLAASDNGIIPTRWNHCYQGIGRCNTFLVKVNEVPDMDSALMSRMKGEARFLRALYYFELETYWGDVPLILGPPDPPAQKNLPRTPREEIIAQVIKDLDSAALLLPLKYGAGDLGRATKGAALALKSRVLLYEASPLFNDKNDASRWKKAADAAKAVIDLAPEAGYGLFDNYRALFLPDNENNKEVIFDVQFIFPDEGNSFDLINSQYNSNAPLLDLAEAYEMKSGKPITDPTSGYNPDSPYIGRDPRLEATIVYPGAPFKGEEATPKYYKQTGFAMKKYCIYDSAAPPKDLADLKAGQSFTNFIVLRYADILLAYAEALNESDPGNPAILSSLNQIRERVHMPAIASGQSQSQMREAIRHERRVETAGEALYYNDVRRWKIAETVLNAPIYNYDHKEIQKRKFNKARDYWWPIPQGELDLNPKLEQNPGY